MEPRSGGEPAVLIDQRGTSPLDRSTLASPITMECVPVSMILVTRQAMLACASASTGRPFDEAVDAECLPVGPQWPPVLEQLLMVERIMPPAF